MNLKLGMINHVCGVTPHAKNRKNWTAAGKAVNIIRFPKKLWFPISCHCSGEHIFGNIAISCGPEKLPTAMQMLLLTYNTAYPRTIRHSRWDEMTDIRPVIYRVQTIPELGYWELGDICICWVNSSDIESRYITRRTDGSFTETFNADFTSDVSSHQNSTFNVESTTDNIWY